ncbi:3-oxoacyl-[acyl-carrier-protein] synthase III C-terminal domain-containing protein [Bacillus pseudomycoides]|uniref:3-oxoacyl-[acyl-carrier-protein] synthase III C-terminal domain-containing protein n=1 Tax=Bacillus pseudomycoides TaxID=64104 RepID=UPI003D6588D1
MIGIAGIGVTFPDKVVDTWERYAQPNGIRKDIWQRMGCHSTYVLEPPLTPTDLAVQAANKALLEAKVNKNEVDLIICNNYNSEYLYWQTSAKIQSLLGCENAYTFDVFGGCNAVGSVVRSAIDIMSQDSSVQNCLLVFTEAISGETWPQFISDGACALLLKREYSDLVFLSHSQVSDIFPSFQRLPVGGTAKPFEKDMKFSGNVYENFEFSAENFRKEIKPIIYPSCEKAIREAIHKSGYKISNIDQIFLVHQQKYVNEKILEMLDLDLNLSPIDYIDDMGHVSGSDVFICMKRAIEDGRIKKGDLLVFAVMGLMDFHSWVIRY